MLREIESGTGVGFSVIDKDGKIIDFKLVVIAQRQRSFFSDGREEFEYAFLSSDGRVSEGSYSGGNTGMGINDLNDLGSIDDKKWQKENRIFETDLNKIIELAKEDVRKQDERHQTEIERKEAEVERLNLRPMTMFLRSINPQLAALSATRGERKDMKRTREEMKLEWKMRLTRWLCSKCKTRLYNCKKERPPMQVHYCPSCEEET